jgi:CelD/BcsL family acetyltransferase involved in cellulose biosynthesis
MSLDSEIEASLSTTLSPTILSERPTVLVGGFKLSFLSNLGACREQWLKLENMHSGTYYQSHAWCHAWVETVGKARNIRPLIIIAQNLNEETAFIFPFQLRRKLGLNILEWLSQPDNNYGLGLFNLEILPALWFEEHFSSLLQAINGHDVINLENMPRKLGNFINPLSSVLKVESANRSYAMQLNNDYEALNGNKRTTKSLSTTRRRDKRLSELGNVTFEIETNVLESHRYLTEALLHKNTQLEQQGIPPIFDSVQQKFFDLLVSSDLRIYRLALDGVTISTVIGAIHNNCFWFMITTMAQSAARQFSPGDLLLRKIIEHCCKSGIERFDFSSGSNEYKLVWADEDVLLYDLVATQRLRGLPHAAALLAFKTAKKFIKGTENNRKLFYAIRRFMRGRRS